MMNNPQDIHTPEELERELHSMNPLRRERKVYNWKEQGMNLFQVDIAVRDLDRMMDFYTELLRLEKEQRFIDTHGDYRIGSIELPTTKLALIETRAEAEEEKPRAFGLQRITLFTGSEDGVEEVYQRAKNLPGCRDVSSPHFDRDNRYKITVTDPEGNRIAFCD